MSAQYDYSPLKPVYKEATSEDEAIELQDVPSVAPVENEKSSCASECDSAKACKNRRCCGTADESRGKRCVRCVFVTVAVVFAFWVVAGAIAFTVVGVKVHRCLHPNHMEVVSYDFPPANFKALELGLVAGKVTVRSCSKAKNVSLVVRNYAASQDLLETMNVQTTIDETTGIHRTVVQGPSFDFQHCQHTWIEVVVPENAQLDLQASGIFSYIEIETQNKALRNVNVAGRVGAIKVEHSNVAGAIHLSTEFGSVSAKDVRAEGAITTRQRVGYAGLHQITAASVDSQVAIGHGCVGDITAETVAFSSEVAYIGFYNVNATQVKAAVEYGKIQFQAQSDFEGHFSTVSPYGFLTVEQGSGTADLVYAKNNEAEKDGTMKKKIPATANVIVADQPETVQRDVSLTSVYGAVGFTVPSPHKRWCNWWKKNSN